VPALRFAPDGAIVAGPAEAALRSRLERAG
jgi:hypothetical protein